jgi:hypothetical protein
MMAIASCAVPSKKSMPRMRRYFALSGTVVDVAMMLLPVSFLSIALEESAFAC